MSGEGQYPADRTRGVLADHKKVGKRLIPPLLQLTGAFHEIKWLDQPLPELVWLGVLHEHFGYEAGSDLAVELAKAASLVTGSKNYFAAISDYRVVDNNQQRRLLRLIDECGLTDK